MIEKGKLILNYIQLRILDRALLLLQYGEPVNDSCHPSHRQDRKGTGTRYCDESKVNPCIHARDCADLRDLVETSLRDWPTKESEERGGLSSPVADVLPRFRCDAKCKWVTTKPSCLIPAEDLLHYFKKHGEFGIVPIGVSREYPVCPLYQPRLAESEIVKALILAEQVKMGKVLITIQSLEVKDVKC